jgi:hypothetical protein
MKITGYVVVCGSSLFGPFSAIEEAGRALAQVSKGNSGTTISIRALEEIVLPTILQVAGEIK